MKYLAIVIGALGFLSGSAYAADLSLKAPPPAPRLTYATGGCGMFYGLNTMGSANRVVDPTAAPGTVIAQGDIGVTLGYGCPMGGPGAFWFVEGNFDFANINGAVTGLSLTGPLHFEQRAGAGGPISTMLNLFPGLSNGLAVPSLPVLPAGVTAGPSFPFMFVSLHERDISAQIGLDRNREWVVSPGLGIGLQTRLSNGVVAETAAQWVLESSGISIGPQKMKLGNGAEVSFTLKY